MGARCWRPCAGPALVALLAAACISGPAPERGASEAPRHARSVLLILADDLGWRDLACTGSRYYRTPHLDALRASSVAFTQAYASAAVCSPTRAAFLTGRSPARVGITDWIHHASPRAQREGRSGVHVPGFAAPPSGRRLRTPWNRSFLPREETTLAEILRARGFRTGYVGKWHLGGEGSLPTEHGFERNAGGEAYGQPPSWFDPFANERFPQGIPSLPSVEPGQYLTAREADEALAWLDRRGADERFCLVYAPYAVHAPIRAPRETVEECRRVPVPPGESQSFATYAAMVRELDASVGRILARLEERGLLDDMLVLFTSDNGGATHFRATSNDPLRKGKGFPYEGGLRVPLLLRLPGRARAGTSCATPVLSADVLPTVLDACGLRAPRGLELDGVSLLRGAELAARERLVWHFPHYWWGGRVTPWSALREGDDKLVYWYEDARAELYDLGADPGEARDLAAEKPALAAAMSRRLRAELEARGARFPAPAGR